MAKQMNETHQYWFAAKKHGWGWGLPLVWQGWVTLAVYGGLTILLVFTFPPEENTTVFIFLTIALSALLILVCRIKGEPAKWRWGK